MRPLIYILIAFVSMTIFGCSAQRKPEKRPNILFAISDDQSFAHTSFAGANFIQTPAFDRVAREGIYFNNCIAGSPGCAPSRSTMVTGRYHWQNEQSGQHASSWMKKYVPFIDLLDANGYITGRTGKGVAPFQYARDENDSLWRATDAGGIAHSNIRYENGSAADERTAGGIGPVNYFENFKYFMENVRGDKPFFFWYGGTEPHRSYEQDSWKRNNKNLSDVEVPGFFPDHEIVRGDILDYAVEIEWFDLHLKRMLEYLEKIGELENTIVIVTSDNGMPFPRAKANGYEYGIHVPFAVRFPKDFPGGRIVYDLVSFADIAPTILELAGIKIPDNIHGKSICQLFKNENTLWRESFVYEGLGDYGGTKPNLTVVSKDYRYIETYQDNQLNQIIYKELYNQKNDTDEMINLVDKPEMMGLINSFQQKIIVHKRNILNEKLNSPNFQDKKL